MDWWIWRLVVSDRIPDGLSEVRRWRFVDALQGHVVLDALEEAAERAKVR